MCALRVPSKRDRDVLDREVLTHKLANVNILWCFLNLYWLACSNGGATYTCPPGMVSSGTSCSGDGTSDTQMCTTGCTIQNCATCTGSVCSECFPSYFITTAGTCQSTPPPFEILTILVCRNGGSSYTCSSGSFKTGTPCTGTSIDTQTCQSVSRIL